MGDDVMKWIRLWCERLTSPQSDTWKELGEAWELYTKLMCHAGRCEQHGKITIPATSLGYSAEQLAEMCQMPQDRFDRQFAVLVGKNKVRLMERGVLEVLDWASFQTAYDKQLEKGYRGMLHQKVTHKGYATEDQKIRRSEVEKSEDQQEQPQASPDGFALARLLHSKVCQNHPRVPTSKLAGKDLDRCLLNWAIEFDTYGRVDKKTRAEYEAIINWSAAHDFWRRQIRSPGALRIRKGGKDAAVWVQFYARAKTKGGYDGKYAAH